MRNVHTAALFALSILLTTPLAFVFVPARGLVFAPLLAAESGIAAYTFSLHIALLATAPLLAVWAVQPRVASASVAAALAILCWLCVASGIGILSADRILITGALALQTLLPFAVFVAASSATPETAKACLKAIPYAASASIVCVAAATVLLMITTPPELMWALLSEALPGVKNLFPVVVAVSLSILLAMIAAEPERKLLWTLFAAHAAFLALIWSRSASIAIIVVFGLWFVRQMLIDRRLLYVAMAGAMAGGLVASHLVGGMSLRSREMAAMELPDRGARPGSPQALNPPIPIIYGAHRRKLLLIGGVHRALEGPIIGDAFHPVNDGEVIAGRPTSGHRIYPSHNQFIDMAIRAGMPALLLFLVFLVAVGRDLWRTAPRDAFSRQIRWCALFLLCGMAVASLFQIYFVVSQPALLIMKALALSIRVSGEQRVDVTTHG